MRLSRKRLAVLAVGVAVLAVCVASVLGAWQVAVVVLALLQGATLLLVMRHGRAPVVRQLKAARRQERALRRVSETLTETSQTLATTNRHIANLDARLTAAQESTRVQLADLTERVRPAD
ncbi:hypothetical protein SAMN05216184_107106 [Georgenia satyanarayanai]|uniref:Uncharacterized protein n=1 Tax=Georgenia satyanarayanai TaxID=860221 RepID=A0A2Y9AIV9_9MICO|nr:hypothetical protein [Georgenia satyanarayanai]PYF99396.1 hypothetical protein A8987_107106 [Georgenia satyanarayanai]SSA43208.1 hypothetical protein SAMN05216184_107106 [Georgenia satyanarayanai]